MTFSLAEKAGSSRTNEATVKVEREETPERTVALSAEVIEGGIISDDEEEEITLQDRDEGKYTSQI